MVMTALGAGVLGGGPGVTCSIIGSTGVHMRSVPVEAVRLNCEGTGYVIALPAPGLVVQMQTNMATSLNIDWVLGLAAEILRMETREISHRDLVKRIEGWLTASRPGQIVYLPYISEAGERGPFANANARASFVGLSVNHGYPDLVRAVVEGLALAARDCYEAMGEFALRTASFGRRRAFSGTASEFSRPLSTRQYASLLARRRELLGRQ